MLPVCLVRSSNALSAVKLAARYCCWLTMENKSLYEVRCSQERGGGGGGAME